FTARLIPTRLCILNKQNIRKLCFDLQHYNLRHEQQQQQQQQHYQHHYYQHQQQQQQDAFSCGVQRCDGTSPERLLSREQWHNGRRGLCYAREDHFYGGKQ
ncbi:hypothetical protein PoB_001562100, partial [Plakobranchus ocellatus]